MAQASLASPSKIANELQQKLHEVFPEPTEGQQWPKILRDISKALTSISRTAMPQWDTPINPMEPNRTIRRIIETAPLLLSRKNLGRSITQKEKKKIGALLSELLDKGGMGNIKKCLDEAVANIDTLELSPAGKIDYMNSILVYENHFVEPAERTLCNTHKHQEEKVRELVSLVKKLAEMMPPAQTMSVAG